MFLKKVNLDDLEILSQISAYTFEDTFRDTTPAHEMEKYLKENCSISRLQEQVENPDSIFYLLYLEENEPESLAGYLKLNWGPAQTESTYTDALEVERLYILPTFKRKGLGTYLLKFAENLALEEGKKILWLGVWEHNYPAQAIYEKMGFVKDGQHAFWVGDDRQIDLIMKKDL